jgi:hypothetical protein
MQGVAVQWPIGPLCRFNCIPGPSLQLSPRMPKTGHTPAPNDDYNATEPYSIIEPTYTDTCLGGLEQKIQICVWGRLETGPFLSWHFKEDGSHSTPAYHMNAFE